MTKFKKALLIGAIVLGVGATSSTVLAASIYNNPAEALAGITGKTVEGVLVEQYETGKSFGAIADEAGKLDEYQKELLEIKKDVVTQRVEAGDLTQEEADRIITSVEENQGYCNGDGFGRGRGGMMGNGYGGMMGRGQGGGCGAWGGFGYNQAR
ncbi:Protein of unknown function (DUF2680) [Desulfitobacterium dichloroeliminans LMG P-21439]|uniref:DUF2680 domain-containing protein n=1 Tax=Desulfitobacterium dichloroeliminans (strain LMG P-21439 / DCA1) TaxID=871963 RepID=L0F8T9_DESDL|nr:DUF2680 domain-containing protein [Desulfitobacterium dichloroeliminans]AGA69046.1 Protein of unknown function (DUF2680) [Desulfitobacterium dichloroeliminans LMG P-21439]